MQMRLMELDLVGEIVFGDGRANVHSGVVCCSAALGDVAVARAAERRYLELIIRRPRKTPVHDRQSLSGYRNSASIMLDEMLV